MFVVSMNQMENQLIWLFKL